jgi:hypothetical protein
VEYLVFDQVMIGYGGCGLWHRNDRPALASPGVVDRPVAADREEPTPEVFIAARESGQVTHYLQPGFAGDIICVIAVQNPQVTQKPGLELPPQLKEARFVT